MKILSAAVVLSISLGANLALACPGHDKEAKAEAAAATPSQISVAEAARLVSAGKATMVDANRQETRQKEGIVPGARLLDEQRKIDPKVLQVSKQDLLIFYCYNEKCGAAPSAAKAALEQGYKVRVMHEGIIGWKKAGQKVQKIDQT
jgi:rhodanese-related sulfurtransferase